MAPFFRSGPLDDNNCVVTGDAPDIPVDDDDDDDDDGDDNPAENGGVDAPDTWSMSNVNLENVGADGSRTSEMLFRVVGDVDVTEDVASDLDAFVALVPDVNSADDDIDDVIGIDDVPDVVDVDVDDAPDDVDDDDNDVNDDDDDDDDVVVLSDGIVLELRFGINGDGLNPGDRNGDDDLDDDGDNDDDDDNFGDDDENGGAIDRVVDSIGEQIESPPLFLSSPFLILLLLKMLLLLTVSYFLSNISTSFTTSSAEGRSSGVSAIILSTRSIILAYDTASSGREDTIILFADLLLTSFHLSVCFFGMSTSMRISKNEAPRE